MARNVRKYKVSIQILCYSIYRGGVDRPMRNRYYSKSEKTSIEQVRITVEESIYIYMYIYIYIYESIYAMLIKVNKKNRRLFPSLEFGFLFKVWEIYNSTKSNEQLSSSILLAVAFPSYQIVRVSVSENIQMIDYT
jgi:hypothetical protein